MSSGLLANDETEFKTGVGAGGGDITFFFFYSLCFSLSLLFFFLLTDSILPSASAKLRLVASSPSCSSVWLAESECRLFLDDFYLDLEDSSLTLVSLCFSVLCLSEDFEDLVFDVEGYPHS